MTTIGETRAITFGGGVSGDIRYNLVMIPDTNIMYFGNYNETGGVTAIYYADFTTNIVDGATSITPIQVTIESIPQTDYNFICYGNIGGTKSIFVVCGGARGIYQKILNNDGTPTGGEAILLPNSTNLPRKIMIACDSTNEKLYVIADGPFTNTFLFRAYDLNTNSYSITNTDIINYTITDFIFSEGSLYINTTGPLYKGTLNSLTNPTTITITEYLGNLAGRNSSALVINSLDTAYITYYGSGNGNSQVYRVDDFYNTKSSSYFYLQPYDLVNGLYFIGLSADESYLFISNRDSVTSGNQILLVLLTIPCLVSGMKIKTPDGYIPIEQLHDGDLIITPDGRHIPIVDVFESRVIGTKNNIPYKIRRHHFEQDIPNEDVLLSPSHALFYKEWILPIWMDNIEREERLIGENFTYYHIELPDYKNDKLCCHNLAIDSFDKKCPESL